MPSSRTTPAREIARELALLGISQLPQSKEKIETQQIASLLQAAIRTLTTEAQDALATAAGELQRSNDRLLSSETRTTDLATARTMLAEAIETTQSAINRLGAAVQMPQWIQSTDDKPEVRTYAIQIVSTVSAKRDQIDEILKDALVDWQINRLARIDRDILRIAVAEIFFLGIPDRVAIDEAVKLAKKYSEDEGFRFINGVMRRVTDQAKVSVAPATSSDS
ncbi:transcription antitermination factor NusB [Aliterella atlantica]|uniref:Transcription antitermination protein NusB n=1 Tax=Aliterella atlantica CENA595 TaxID=1618023 RepID=A0A0D8ZU10_9CYAN|nr:transcription antitermination factor NusB [Aliterella atlantica]KJH70721.1 transcription antiterminator NusB [Aliterella atlantica CENA595]